MKTRTRKPAPIEPPPVSLYVRHAHALLTVTHYLAHQWDALDELSRDHQRDGVAERELSNAFRHATDRLAEMIQRQALTSRVTDEQYRERIRETASTYQSPSLLAEFCTTIAREQAAWLADNLKG